MTTLDEGLSDDPLHRLGAVVGRDAAAGMLVRFRSRLAAVASDPVPDGDERAMAATAHGIGGLAGMLGFGDLAACWLAVERDGRCRLPAARDATEAALRRLDALLGPAPDDAETVATP